MKKILFTIVLVALAALSFGCNGNSSLSGKVTFADNGDPVTNGSVFFENDKTRSRATIKPDGSYVVGTLKEKDGLPRGTYLVSVSGGYLPQEIPEGVPYDEIDFGAIPTISEIDEKYAHSSTSGLTLVVDKGKIVYDIKVERAGK